MALRFRMTRVDACPPGWVPYELRALMEHCEHGQNTVVCAVGTTESGNGVTLYLFNLLPHFYVEAPPQLCGDQLPELRERLEQLMDGPKIRSLQLEPETGVRDPRDYEPRERPLLRVTLQSGRDIGQARLVWLDKHYPAGFRWHGMQFPARVWQADTDPHHGVGADVRSVTDAWVSVPAGAYVSKGEPAGPPSADHHLVLAADYSDLVIEAPPEPITRPAPTDKVDLSVACLYDSLSSVQDGTGVVCLLERVLRTHLGPTAHATDRLFSPAAKPPPPREPDEQRWPQKGGPQKPPPPKAKPKGVAVVPKPKSWAVKSAADRKGKAPRGQPLFSFGGGGAQKRPAADDDDE